MSVTRRQALIFGGLGIVGAGIVTVPISGVSAKSASKLSDRDMPRPYRTPLTFPPPPAFKTTVDAEGVTTRHYTLTQRLGTAQILPRLSTPILGYNGIFPGPTFRIDKGTPAVVHMRNQLPAKHPALGYALPTSTHLHGSASLPQFDGYANDLTLPGFYKDYQYPNHQPARTLWYHDHAAHFTAQNVYSGLAGQYLISDPVEKGLLPQGNLDIPLTISDAMFAASGALGYDDREHSGLWGDVILVNGKPWPVMKVQRRVYRFRILNASVSRSYRFTLSTGDPVTVVATDAGLIPEAQTIGSWRHSSAERYEVLIDFRKYAPGRRVELCNLSK
ncbi:FtsP/CotA-like multicopper oxidase with cupredoxin domain [Arthrobacter sp. V4I6]|uniref:multicopper oxidase family protein n=1 Tax=unclassified Arthrobacter TaxID=235627 RepID=UPI002785D2D3|nr:MULTISPECIES: multicopper oxidase domain-containing protein [unclassified Arthrobacter]MDQ0822154.1 FtsP/CotA-like multicopper oxidase with cupredoxin domain [Arthrobacter sp. V1I7]MDQ0856422.1 FtsP/CotA-like multicopper oxidase with cupredoxin domain [Arthrobacter sp. V4I6]